MNPQSKMYENMKSNDVFHGMGINGINGINSMNGINGINNMNNINNMNGLSLSGLDIEKILKEKATDENYYFLLLSIYFYLKHNNYHTTAEMLFNEVNLGKVFQFPQEVPEPQTDIEKIKKKFINYFYYNTFFQQSDTSDFLSDFWNQFWEIFVTKIKQSNQTNSVLEKYLAEHKMTLTCKKIKLNKKMIIFNMWRWWGGETEVCPQFSELLTACPRNQIFFKIIFLLILFF
jgi:hypothetical protein